MLVPAKEVSKSSGNRRVSSPGYPPRTDLSEITEVIGEVIHKAVETSASYDPRTVRTLESAIETLCEQLATERHLRSSRGTRR